MIIEPNRFHLPMERPCFIVIFVMLIRLKRPLYLNSCNFERPLFLQTQKPTFLILVTYLRKRC